jgi:DNA repair protein SbcD/Mre11
MRILHSSDWHLGRVLHGQSLLEDQEHALDQILDHLIRDGYDALIVAGDVYDRAVPPPDAVSLLGSFLQRLAEADIQAIIIAGNHDSATRLGFADGIMDRAGIHIRSDYTRLSEPVTLVDGNGVEVDVFALPFVEVALLREALDLGQDDVRTTSEAVAGALDSMREVRREDVPTILVSHEFVGSGAITSDSERVFIGGAHVLDESLYQGFDYVALGHLHRPQSVGAEMVRYSGSLLGYSFSEAEHKKGAVSLTFPAGQQEPTVERVGFTPLRPLSVLKDSFDALRDDSRYDVYRDHYVSAQLTDEGSHLNLHATLRARFPLLLEVRQLGLEERRLADINAPASNSLAPTALFKEFIKLFGWDGEDESWATSTFEDAVQQAQAKERRQ